MQDWTYSQVTSEHSHIDCVFGYIGHMQCGKFLSVDHRQCTVDVSVAREHTLNGTCCHQHCPAPAPACMEGGMYLSVDEPATGNRQVCHGGWSVLSLTGGVSVEGNGTASETGNWE